MVRREKTRPAKMEGGWWSSCRADGMSSGGYLNQLRDSLVHFLGKVGHLEGRIEVRRVCPESNATSSFCVHLEMMWLLKSPLNLWLIIIEFWSNDDLIVISFFNWLKIDTRWTFRITRAVKVRNELRWLTKEGGKPSGEDSTSESRMHNYCLLNVGVGI